MLKEALEACKFFITCSPITRLLKVECVYAPSPGSGEDIPSLVYSMHPSLLSLKLYPQLSMGT